MALKYSLLISIDLRNDPSNARTISFCGLDVIYGALDLSLLLNSNKLDSWKQYSAAIFGCNTLLWIWNLTSLSLAVI